MESSTVEPPSKEHFGISHLSFAERLSFLGGLKMYQCYEERDPKEHPLMRFLEGPLTCIREVHEFNYILLHCNSHAMLILYSIWILTRMSSKWTTLYLMISGQRLLFVSQHLRI